MKKLRVLFLNELAGMYDAEMRIIKALPKFANATSCQQLKHAFLSHLQETMEHVVKINHIFEKSGERPRARKCPAAIELIKEGVQAVVENKGQPTLNAALVAVGQKVEHYEIASYGCLHDWARLLQNEVATQIIEEILKQERDCDETLKGLAVEKNQEALDADSTNMKKAVRKIRGHFMRK